MIVVYESILIATDRSEGVQRAIEEGIELATAVDATVHALYVIDDRAHGVLPNTEVFGVEAALEAEGEKAITDVEERAREAGVDVVTTIEQGNPHEEIVAYADREDIDCIVMGAHGRSGIDRVLLGSVTENVVRKTDRPVHVVPLEGNGANRDGPSGRSTES